MSESPDDLSIEYEQDGVVLVKELDKKILSRGAWTTIIYRYQEWDRNKQAYSGDKFTIRRYQKRNGQYQQKSKFNISSVKQAKELVSILNEWVQDE